jgi:hypothetical protein
MNQETIYFLKISGYLKKDKQKEFGQTVEFIISQLPSECIASNLAEDIYDSDLFHFFLVCPSIEILKNFKESQEFKMLTGSFNTLGQPKNTRSGCKSNLILFELNYLETSTSEL